MSCCHFIAIGVKIMDMRHGRLMSSIVERTLIRLAIMGSHPWFIDIQTENGIASGVDNGRDL
jgi:hypothetical protein